MKKIFALSFFAFHLGVFSQTAVQRTEYFDWQKTKIAHTWFELGDGTKHGSEKYYYDNGKLQVEYIYSKGDIKKALSYYSDGTQGLISNHFNRWILDGEVKYYNWLNGIRFLQYNGVAKKEANQDYDKVSLMEIYFAPNKKLLSFTDNGIIQEYIEYANSTRHTDELGNYVPKPISSGQSKITVSKGIIKFGKCNGDEIIDGKFTKIGNFNGNVTAKIEGDTVIMTEITDLDSIIYTKIKSWDIQIELYPVMSVNPLNEYLNFNLSYKIPGASISDKIFVVNFNERSNDLSGLFNEYWKQGYSDVGFYRKYSRKNKNLSYESYTTLENNTLIVKYKKWFHENGKLKEFWDGKKTEKYSIAGILIEKISADTIQRYFENGSLALDSNTNYSKAYFSNGKVIRDISIVNGLVNSYKIYDSLGMIVYQGEIKTTISKKNKEAIALEEKLNAKFTLAKKHGID
jgi:antitoxin component YwqK of YwqJK toxin-antitoxin module